LSSVIIGWTGQCKKASQQKEILLHLEKIPCPKKIFNETISGKILLEPFSPYLDSREYIYLDEVSLNGIELQLVDSRKLYDTRMSFVFMSSKKHPQLDGTIVLLENHEKCLLYREKQIQKADWLLARPSIQLRYINEGWVLLLLGGLHHFYIPQLDYDFKPSKEEFLERYKQILESKDVFFKNVRSCLEKF